MLSYSYFFQILFRLYFINRKQKGWPWPFFNAFQTVKFFYRLGQEEEQWIFALAQKKVFFAKPTDNLISSSAHKNRLILLCYRILKYFGFPKEIKLFLLLYVFSIRNLMDAFGAMITQWREILCKIDPKCELLQKQNCVIFLSDQIFWHFVMTLISKCKLWKNLPNFFSHNNYIFYFFFSSLKLFFAKLVNTLFKQKFFLKCKKYQRENVSINSTIFLETFLLRTRKPWTFLSMKFQKGSSIGKMFYYYRFIYFRNILYSKYTGS